MLLLQMGWCRIEKFSFIHLLIAGALVKQMVPDEATAAEGLPDEDLLLHGRVYPELHALGDNDGFSPFFRHNPLPACGCIPSVSQEVPLPPLSDSSSSTRSFPSTASPLFQENPSSPAWMRPPCMRL